MSISRRHVLSNCTDRLLVFLDCIEGFTSWDTPKSSRASHITLDRHMPREPKYSRTIQADTPATRLEGVGSVERLNVLLLVFDFWRDRGMWHRKDCVFSRSVAFMICVEHRRGRHVRRRERKGDYRSTVAWQPEQSSAALLVSWRSSSCFFPCKEHQRTGRWT